MIHELFPTLVVSERPKLPRGLVDRLLKEAYQYRELDAAGRRWSAGSYPHGYTSYSSITNLHEISPTFARLAKELDRSIARFASRLEMDLKKRKLRISTIWINIMGQTAHHAYHLHPLSVVSGTFYLKVPKGAPGLRVEDPRIAGYMGSPARRSNAREENRRYIDLPCSRGQLILFESWLKHEVPINQSAEDRVSVSFNYE